MKFFLDTNIPHSAIDIFKELDLDAAHARDVGLSRVDDSQIINYAKKHDSILITKDLELANVKIFPIDSHRGVIIFRLPSNFKSSQFINTLRDFLNSVNLKELNNSISIVRLGSYRIRKFNKN